MRERLPTLAALALVVLGGALSWWLQLRAGLEVQPNTLDALPYRLGPFEGVDTSIDSGVEQMLQADHHVQRQYLHPVGGVVSLYVGYYGTRRGGTPEHTPSTCYTAQGWSILERTTLPGDVTGGAAVREYLVESRGRRDLVIFWYQSFRRSGMVSTVQLRLDHLLGQIHANRGDGALVRLSTPLFGIERDAARSLLLNFARHLGPELEARWPREAPRTADRGEPSGDVWAVPGRSKPRHLAWGDDHSPAIGSEVGASVRAASPIAGREAARSVDAGAE